MYKVTFDVDRLLRLLAVKNNRDYDKSLMAEMSGISRTTINAITTNQSTRIDLDTIGKLIAFFTSEGMPIAPSDIFTVKRIDDNK